LEIGSVASWPRAIHRRHCREYKAPNPKLTAAEQDIHRIHHPALSSQTASERSTTKLRSSTCNRAKLQNHRKKIPPSRRQRPNAHPKLPRIAMPWSHSATPLCSVFFLPLPPTLSVFVVSFVLPTTTSFRNPGMQTSQKKSEI
jgi:hypothetical protein